MKRWQRRLVLGALAAAMAFLLAASVLVGVGWNDRLAHSDVALVLGTFVQEDGKPAPRLCARLDAALQLYRAGYFNSIIVSGGIDPAGHDEASIMRDYLVERGVPPEAIIMDNQGVDTYASARQTVQILRQHHWSRVCVVTQYFHIPRAQLALTRFGVSEVSSGSARRLGWRDLYSIPREVAGYAWYAIRRYPDAPTASGSTNNTPPRRLAWPPPGKLTLAGPAPASSSVRTRSTSA